MKRGTFQLMKSVNKSTVLNKIRLSEPLSRAQIAQETGITPPTVSSIVKELIDENLVEESILGESRGGRKPTMLLIKRSGHYVIGIDAGSNAIKGVATDLVGTILSETEIKIVPHISKEYFLQTLKEVVRTIFMGIDDKNKILGIGVAMHGVVDVSSGISLYSSNSGLRDVPIKEELEKEFKVRVMVENNSRAMALGEYWFGDHDEVDSFVAINIGRGVGAGIVDKGRLYYGAQGIAGEMGHMVIDLNGRVCSCGNRGCFETFVTGEAIVKRAKEQIKDAPDNLTAEDIYTYAKENNKNYLKILEETGQLIGIGVVNLIHMLNPNKIVLGGGVLNSAEFLMPTIRQTIQERALTEKVRKNTIIEVSVLGKDATILGAAALLLAEIF
ncbi:ROK family transcriptional regulator [Carnobacterium funditum]|uniref:ROK family transcriptional regulator n=1 Tax=Carnobacterium funditum TaxID=2752 RepID=UPI0005598063|nr:ROK family transcriptional regulator [Carnobacterium funditum]